ncbi:MAG: hypothetical protein HXS53_09790 [Theionarchaea archaeon]|nr:hypothetical protein [Theionarchaea archaeon]
MELRDLLELSVPRLIITSLLFIYCLVTLPFLSINQTICQQEGIDCTSEVHHVPLYYCIIIGFEKEYHTPYLYSLEVCNKKGIAWFLIIIPLLYGLSYFIHERWEVSIDAWRFGSKSDLITLLVLIFTIIPPLIFGIVNHHPAIGPLTAYTYSPIAFIYAAIHSLISGRVLFPLIILGGLILLFCGIFFSLKKWEIPHPAIYTSWIIYLTICIIGLVI